MRIDHAESGFERSKPVERNLLFGVMALKLDFISRDGLLQGMKAWVLNKTRQLGDILVGQANLTAEHRDLLEPLLAAQVEQNGSALEKSLGTLGPFATILQDLEQLADGDLSASLARVSATRSVDKIAAGANRTPFTGSRFEILRSHSKDGIRNIWVAFDNELQREVALKVYNPERTADPDSRFGKEAQRRLQFVHEAEITGCLEHPGIVPVYSLGEYSAGRPFYAMRFIRGKRLTVDIEAYHRRQTSKSIHFLPILVAFATIAGCPTWIALAFLFSLLGPLSSLVILGVAAPFAIRFVVDLLDLPAPRFLRSRQRHKFHTRDLELRRLLSRFINVCNTVAYAHSRGVLHRDLRPDNIILGKYGETLVSNWTLSTTRGRKEAGSNEAPLRPFVTSGSAAEIPELYFAGTPGYASPEQISRPLDELGPASDVYNLGATLYHILTGVHPFHADNVAMFAHKVLRGRFVPPRQVVSSLSPALEAICLKAMALEPQDRYQSAQALADDVERWLADERVEAYREPLDQRISRLLSQKLSRQKNRGAISAVVAVAWIAILLFAGTRVVSSEWKWRNKMEHLVSACANLATPMEHPGDAATTGLAHVLSAERLQHLSMAIDGLKDTVAAEPASDWCAFVLQIDKPSQRREKINQITEARIILTMWHNMPNAQRSVENLQTAVDVIRTRAEANAGLQHWKELEADLRVLRVGSPDDVRLAYEYAVSLLALQDWARWRGTCAEMYARFKDSPDAEVQSAMFYASIPLENGLPATILLQIAQKCNRHTPDSKRELAAALYRDGQFAPCVVAFDEHAAKHALRGWDWFFKSMAHHRVNEPEKARAAYEQGLEWLTTAEQNTSKKDLPPDAIRFRTWMEGVETRALQEEASALVAGSPQPR